MLCKRTAAVSLSISALLLVTVTAPLLAILQSAVSNLNLNNFSSTAKRNDNHTATANTIPAWNIDPPHQSKNLKYTAELAAKAVEPTTWTCGEAGRQKDTVIDPITKQRPFFAFVHVYKTGGTTVRSFFEEYATICKKSLALVAKCKFRMVGSGIENCRLLKSVNAPLSIERVNSTVLHDHYDILGGHFSFGMADDIFSNASNEVRHMIFLRQPLTRFVSHVLYQQKQGKTVKTDTIEGTAEEIKKSISSFRENGEYMGSLTYPQSPVIYNNLLTPEQKRAVEDDQELMTKEEVLAHKIQLAIGNLMRYNTIVGMTESFSQSIKIFEHAMGQIVANTGKEEEVQELFSMYIDENEKISKNASAQKNISTDLVLQELHRDDEFMAIFREFVKYEQMIVDFAMDMHQKQYEAVKEGDFERYVFES